MSTIFSLICFGGKDGKTVTFTDAGDVVNLTNHGLRDATEIVFTDNAGNTLPTGLSKNTTYYAKSTGANTFTLYTTSALSTQVTFTGTGTGTHKVKSRYYYDLSDVTRWGTTRIYDGIKAWRDARFSAAAALDTEYCEIGMAWNDWLTAALSLNVPAAQVYILPQVDGVATEADHSGVYGAGYNIKTNAAFAVALSFSGNRHVMRNISVSTATNDADLISLSGYYNEISGIFAYGATNTGVEAFRLGGAANTIVNNVAFGVADGFYFTGYNGAGNIYANNLACKCTNGFVLQGGGSEYRGWWYNNMSVGNTTNWGASAPAHSHGMGYNYGASGNAVWYTGTDTSIKTLTADGSTFVDYTNNDFHPVSTAPQVDTASVVVGMTAIDIGSDVRPNYNNGGAEAWDGGPFEYDNGYGLAPEEHTLDFSGVVSGSQIIIYTAGTTTELLRNDSTGTTLSYDGGAVGATSVDYTILKTGYAPIRSTSVSLAATSTPVAVAQQLDRAYATPSGLTFGTNVIVNVTARVVTSMQVTVATTPQNWYSYLMDCFIASTTNTTLKNVAFPVITFGEASFTTINGIEFSDGATSISKFSRDGFRYSSDAGVTPTAIWAAILTLNTPAGQQVKYRQATAGTITNAANTGPMDQLVQVYGDATHGNFDYRGHMVLRAPKVGWSQPQPDLIATYGNLVDGLFVAALEPLLQYATTDADIDAANLALDNTAKTYTITAAHTMTELYQRAQWWANQDAQWDADIPLTTTNGGTFTQPSTWAMTGVSYLTGGTLAGGTATLAVGTQGIAYNGVTLLLGAAGTYTFTADTCLVKPTPTAPSTYIFGSGTFTGTLTVNNLAAHAITIEIPSGVTTSTTGNTGGAITFSAPAIYQSVTVSGISTTSRVQIYDTTSSTELYNDVPGATSTTWTDSVAAAATRAIRVRIADVVTVTAKTFIEANIGTCAVSGAGKDISYLASQTADTTYDSNGLNGPSIYATSGITFTDAATDLVNCNIAGGSVTYPTIYACFVYWNFTAAGIANDFTYVDAPDTANYLFSSMKIRNTSAVDLMVTGGYGRDATSGLSSDIIDTAGSTGNIFLAPDHVVAYATGSGALTAGDISNIWSNATRTITTTIPSAVDVAAETVDALSAITLPVNITQVIGTNIAGTGTEADPWGPV